MQYILPVFLPLLSFLIGGLFGHKMNARLYNFISCALLGIACLVGWIVFYSVIVQGRSMTIPLFKWIEIGKIVSTWTIVYSPITVTLVVTVLTVSTLVHIYSTGYMSHDDTPKRFMAYLGLFTFMMLMLVVADDLLQLFFGWEGVGLASYLLIGYWYGKPSANAAAMKAFVVNRIGDLGLILGIACIYFFFKTLHMDTILSMIASSSKPPIQFLGMNLSVYDIIAGLLFFGAMGKSAQLGLHTWLPDAMEGPTPVSALIHAATMVTAGVFLVARLSPLFEMASTVKGIIVVIGASTAFFAGTIALTQNDIKRVIAYSTCSQLGYMFLATGLGAYNAALFHLVTHAFFKALLFLGAGSVIHAMSDEQDMRNMGGLWRYIPKTYLMMIIGTLAITGVPFFSGFFSKEAIIDAARDSTLAISHYGYVLAIIATLLTALYSWRLIFLTFHGRSRASEIVQSHFHEPGASMLLPLWVLVVGAIFAGYIGEHPFLSISYWRGSLVASEPFHPNHLSFWAHYLPLICTFGGFVVAYLFYMVRPDWPSALSRRLAPLYRFLRNKWYVDELYTIAVINPYRKLGLWFWKRGDEQTIDAYGPDGIALKVNALSKRTSLLQTGYIYHYVYAMIGGVILMMLYYFIARG